MDYKLRLIKHYEKIWNSKAQIKQWNSGPIHELSKDFCILEFHPSETHHMWAYSTCCMSELSDANPIELHMFSISQNDELIELLTAVAHYHRTDSCLGLNHTVYFGKPWQFDSNCTHGLVSLPYIDGPKLENLFLENNNKWVKCYWLIPITPEELNYAVKNGINFLETKLENQSFNYLDINRLSVV